MSFLKSFGRPFVLIVLFAGGAGLIWHIGQHLDPSKGVVPRVPGRVVQKPELRAELPRPAPPDSQSQPAPVHTVALPGGPRIARTERGQFVVTEPILFNSGASTLREASLPRLNKIAELLNRRPHMTLEIVGHTDNLGPEPVNQKVSAERAEIVMNYLIAQGIAPSRLRFRGMGSLDPIESNDTQLGRQANRRIEFLIMGDPGSQ